MIHAPPLFIRGYWSVIDIKGRYINKCCLFMPKIAKKIPRAARGCADPYAARGLGAPIRQIPRGIHRIGSDSAQIEGGEGGEGRPPWLIRLGGP